MIKVAMTWCQLFLGKGGRGGGVNLPEESWGERNDLT